MKKEKEEKRRIDFLLQAFRPQHFAVFEYLEDLKKYYKMSYGQDLNRNVSCSAVQDLLHHLDDNNGPKTVAYFTHSAAIVLLLTALRIAHDMDTLRADNFHDMQQRQFRISALTPFAANFMAIKYDCPNEPITEKVAFFLNEKPVHLDWCDESGLCNLSDVKEQYGDYMNMDCESSYCVRAAT